MEQESMTTSKSEGLSNKLTLWIMIGSLITTLVINYTLLTSKVDHISEQLQEEVLERKLEDERLWLELDRRWDDNTRDHRDIMDVVETVGSDIKDIKEDLTYHLGQHKGNEAKK